MKRIGEYIGNTIWLLAERFFRLVAGVLVGVLVARHLGPHDFGILGFSQSYCYLFFAVATLGVDSVLVKRLVSRPDENARIMTDAFILRMLAGVAAFLLMYLGLLLGEWGGVVNQSVLIISLSVYFYPFLVIDLYFQSKVLSKYHVIASLVALSASSAMKLAFIAMDMGVRAIALAVLLEVMVLAAGLSVCLAWRADFRPSFRVNWAGMASLLREGWPLLLSTAVVATFMKIDQVMLQELSGSSEVGIYSAAARLSESIYFIPVAIAGSVFPSLVAARSRSEGIFFGRLQALMTGLVWMAIAMALAATVLSDWMVTFLYGIEYVESGWVLSIHVWSAIFVFFGTAWGKWMVIDGMQRTVLKIHSATLVLNVGLNLFLIPLHGAGGAAVATLVSYSAGHTVFALAFRNQRRALRMLVNAILMRGVWGYREP